MVRPTIRGIRLRLALALLLVVAGALGVVYLIVVPSLEAELVSAKLDQLEEDAKTVATGFAIEFDRPQEYADVASSAVQARVVIYTVAADQLLIQADSRTTSSRRRGARSGCDPSSRHRQAAARHGGAGRPPFRRGGGGREARRGR